MKTRELTLGEKQASLKLEKWGKSIIFFAKKKKNSACMIVGNDNPWCSL